MVLLARFAQPNPIMGCSFPGFGFGAEVRVDLNDFRAYLSRVRNCLRVFLDLRQPSLHADKRFAEAAVGHHLYDNSPRMPDEPSAQGHHPLHNGAQPAAPCLLQPNDPGVEKRLAHHSQHVVHQDPELEEQLVEAELSGRMVLQVEFTFQLCEVLLARTPIAVQTQDVGVGHLLDVRPDAEDFVLRQEQGLPFLAGPFDHLVDEPDRSYAFTVSTDASHVDGLAGPGRMALPFLHNQVDQDLGFFPAQIVAGDKAVTGMSPRRYECHIIEGRVVHPEQGSLGQLAHPRTDCRKVASDGTQPMARAVAKKSLFLNRPIPNKLT